MGYVIGQPYKRVVGFKNGSPVYEMTEVIAVFPDKIVLASGTVIDYTPAPTKSGTLTRQNIKV